MKRMKLHNGTGHAELRYIYQDRDRHGNIRTYFKRRKGSKKIRLHAPMGTAAFEAEYQAAIIASETAAPTPHKTNPGTFRWLVMQYIKSGEFAQLELSTQTVRRRIFDHLCATYGDGLLAQLESKHIRKIRDAKAAFPAAANSRLKLLRVLFKWAIEAGLVTSNPAKDVPRLKIKSDGFHAWTEDELLQYEARHLPGTKARLALAILLFTGTRRSDAVRLGRQMETTVLIDGQHTRALRFRQKKTNKWLTLPILKPLADEIARHNVSGLTYLLTDYGRSFSPAGFGNWFRERCDEAGLTQCSAHGLRKAGATRAANNGATASELKAVFGWASIEEAERYTKTADQQRLAGSGIHYLEQK